MAIIVPERIAERVAEYKRIRRMIRTGKDEQGHKVEITGFASEVLDNICREIGRLVIEESGDDDVTSPA